MPDATTVTQSTAPASASAMDYVRLMKPRVMSLVVFTALAGLVAAPGDMNAITAATSILAVAVGAGAAGALNMWYDADIDAMMARTISRPVPAGLIRPDEARSFGLIMSALSVTLMALAATPLAALLLAFSIFFYAVVYTMWLKRSTAQNIVIGGAAGAFPPVIGWAAATGSAPLDAWLLFGLIFLWTPPHFWSLALYRAGDYARAGVPMLPVVAGDRATRRQILLYTAILLPVAPLPAFLGLAGWLYCGAAMLLGLAFLALAVALQRDRSERRARQSFAFSILYLFLLFALLIVDRAPGLWGAPS
jgi:protoheme IX farnesyltransferase